MNYPSNSLDVHVPDEARRHVLAALCGELRRRPDLVADASPVVTSAARLLLPLFLRRKLEAETTEVGAAGAVEIFTVRVLVGQAVAGYATDPCEPVHDGVTDRLRALHRDLLALPDPQGMCPSAAMAVLDSILADAENYWKHSDLLGWISAQTILATSAGDALVITAMAAELTAWLDRPQSYEGGEGW